MSVSRNQGKVQFEPPINNAMAPRPGRVQGLAGYLVLIAGAVAVFFAIRFVGESLQAPATHVDAVPGAGRHLAGHFNLVPHVLATLAAVIATGHVVGRLFRYVGQPPVIGEVVAGILLGPSLLGAISPDVMHLLVPSSVEDPRGQTLAALAAVSQLGVILYMFLVGLELNTGRLAKSAHAAVAVSHISIVVPFTLGAALALGLYPVFSHQGVPFTSFALFMGVAMAITAFPVLARILTDQGLEKTDLGSVALSCAAADDVTAWCLLAFVSGVAQSDVSGTAGVFAGATVFIGGMFFGVKPLLRQFATRFDDHEGPLPQVLIGGVFLTIVLAALTTEIIGIHAPFGAFLLGAVVPHDCRIAGEFTAKLKDVATTLLLPAFFALAGMRTQIALVSGWENWLWCGAIIFVATAGKFGGALAAARITGMTWRDSAALGVL